MKAPFLPIPASSIIHGQRPDELLPFVLFHRRNLKVCTLHGVVLEGIDFLYPKYVATAYKLVESLCMRYIDGVIAVGEDTKHFYEQRYPRLKGRIEVIPNGVDLQKFKPMDQAQVRGKYGFRKEDQIVLYVGRVEREKNLGFLIRAYAILKSQNERSKLVLVGDGRDRANMQSLINQLGLKDVTLTGTMPPDEIPEIMNCADVFALCSLFEGDGPIVIKEALASGVPIVSTDVGEAKHLVKNDMMGIIVDRDEKSFGQALGDMIQKDRDVVRKECRDNSQQFSSELMVSKTVAFYRKIQDVAG